MSASPLPIRAFQWDLARQVERLSWLRAQLPRYADWGYQELYLHLEDAVDYPSLPGVARRDAYSYGQLERLVTDATRAGIKVVPIVNLLGHTQYLIKVPELRDLNELRETDGSPRTSGQICPLHPRTLEVAERLLHDMAPFCTAGKVHVGLDESFHLGKHPLSRREVKRIGLAGHFARYVHRLRGLTRGIDLRMGIWADMLYFLPEAIPLLPRDLIAYDWYYYPFKRHPCVELRNFVEHDLAAPLQRHGIEYWGCPMNGAFRHEPMPHFSDRLANAESWWRRCRQVGAAGFLMTSWEPNRLAMETATLVDAAVAELWLNPRNRARAGRLHAGLRRVFGRNSQASIARQLLGADCYAFTGYARWEINKAWSSASGPASRRLYRAEQRFFERVDRPASRGPEPLAASIRYRRYLAARDVFVREARQVVLALRKAPKQTDAAIAQQLNALDLATRAFAAELKAGAVAARRMWRSTRHPNPAAPNHQLIAADRQQLLTWQAWLDEARRDHAQINSPSPVCGVWVLRYLVWNHAPAVQRIAVEQQTPSGWQTIKSCHTIAFQSRGAKPQGTERTQHWVALTGPFDQLPTIRFRIGGVGMVKLSGVQISNGVIRQAAADWRGWRTLGARPRAGWPDLGREQLVPLAFAKAEKRKRRPG
ncbi:MAG: family 20 glycosylhydrolase [Cephaloticoccus sp.]